ncbi:MAG: hypothetical protein PHT12_05625 [Patescibacteria group bacterium]|nr:hypothetical protein [Patescibacteria group bacterium]
MSYIARICLSTGWGDDNLIEAHGDTPEEASARCRELIQPTISVELAEGVDVPPEVAKGVPEKLPAGCGLLIMVRCSHSSGEAYDWRFFAIRRGPLSLGWTGRERTYEIGDKPVEHVFTDCNADYEYVLPEGSSEFVDGAWVSRSSAEYDY